MGHHSVQGGIDAKAGAPIEALVETALARGDVGLAFQPVVRAQMQKSTAFYEALIRVYDRAGQIIPACEFMPHIETGTLGRQADVVSLDAGCRALHDTPHLRLSINMSARSIGHGPWMDTLERWLERDDSIGPRLILEITESSAMTDPDRVVRFMDGLHMRGICFALDDFGSGFTALRYFKNFFFDVLKIDGQFIRGIAGDDDNIALTKAMITLGHQFDMLTVAEMVETEADMKVLRALGVDCLQGFFFGAPTTAPPWHSGDAAYQRAG